MALNNLVMPKHDNELNDPWIRDNNDHNQQRHQNAYKRRIQDYIVPFFRWISIEHSTSTRSRKKLKEFEPILFQTLPNVGLSSGLSHEDAYRHSINFLETCDSHKQKGATPEALQMRESIQTHSSTSEDRSIYLIMNTFYSPL